MLIASCAEKCQFYGTETGTDFFQTASWARMDWAEMLVREETAMREN